MINAFQFSAGRVLAGKYQVVQHLGTGWEGEVYLVKEILTGIERAAKFFYPHRDPQSKKLIIYAQKLHLLQHCTILIQYHTQDSLSYKGHKIPFLISEYVEGEPLHKYQTRQTGKRMDTCSALLLLHELASGIESIHHMGEYHGDLHTENIIVRRHGIGFEVKLIDMFNWGAPKKVNIHDDVCDLVRIFYDITGGQRHYSKQPKIVKNICCGLKRTLILKKFRSAGQLREYLERMEWDT